MATLIYVDKENGGLVNTTSKDRVRLPSVSGKARTFSERSLLQTPRSGKVFNAAPGLTQSARKALGNVNSQVESNKAVAVTNKRNVCRKPKVQASAVPKREVEFCKRKTEENYPEIEKLIPYDPSDFECFEVPEEHKLSHLNLAGVPLFVLEKEKEHLDKLVNMVPSPMKMPLVSWELDFLQPDLSNLPTVEEITVDLPPIYEL
ncbi:securin [Rhinatrema bivittatum]|uniref:securin n=1 Tax=Rhinatrema bivittatum TaxID=194408 RepID=UPI00112C2F29|nr:securin [Rhinatrema bivittatum]